MKGLASTNSSFARVNVSRRCARKHYGIAVSKWYDPEKYSHLVEHRYVVTLQPKASLLISYLQYPATSRNMKVNTASMSWIGS